MLNKLVDFVEQTRRLCSAIQYALKDNGVFVAKQCRFYCSAKQCLLPVRLLNIKKKTFAGKITGTGVLKCRFKVVSLQRQKEKTVLVTAASSDTKVAAKEQTSYYIQKSNGTEQTDSHLAY
ncbi:MAG: hypothetical protein IJ612_07585 [Prevotella sp.]|nr:hypothetical protein [Prevotella sp.]